MKPRVVVLARGGRPSGALLCWRLVWAGYDPLILVESRSRMVKAGGGAVELLKKHGVHFLFRRLTELVLIKAHFYGRRLLGKHFKSPAYLSLEELALDYPLRIRHVEDHNSDLTLQLLCQENADVGILSNTRKIRAEILLSPRHGFLNLHGSLLPKYAGLDSVFWALYHGEKEVGATVHFAVPEIDRGGIILQERIPVTEWDDVVSLERKLRWIGTGLVMRVLDLLEAGKLCGRAQEGEGSYFSWPTAAQRAELRKKITASHNPSPRPRILHIITRMTRGGAQENTLATVRGLRQKGYDVTLVTGPSWGREGEILSEALAEGHAIVLMPELGREVDLIKDTLAFFKLIAFLRRGRFDLVHTHMSKGGLLGRTAAWLAGAPRIVHTPHGHIFHSYFSRATERFFLLLERRLARVTDRLIALTDSEKREHLNFYVGTRNQWRVIPSGVNEARFTAPPINEQNDLRKRLGINPQTKVAGFLGRLDTVKGPAYFVEALPKIFASYPDVRALVVGDGKLRGELEQRAKTYGIADRVIFTGDQRQTALYLSLMDVLVVPSLNEGMGRVIVEAGLLSKPVVASRVGGIPDLVEDERTGLLVPPRDSAAIEQAVIRVLEATGRAHALGENLKRKVLANFTESRMIEALERLYSELLHRESPSLSSFAGSVNLC